MASNECALYEMIIGKPDSKPEDRLILQFTNYDAMFQIRMHIRFDRKDLRIFEQQTWGTSLYKDSERAKSALTDYFPK